jgi:hypothetical protein
LIKKASLVVLSVLSLGGLGGDLSGGRLIGVGPAVVAKLVFQPGNSRSCRRGVRAALGLDKGRWSPET